MDDLGLCDGGGDAEGEHCCWVAGEACPHLVVDGPTGRRFACNLFTELGDWDLVHADDRYLANPKPTWTRLGVQDCGRWIGLSAETMVAIKGRGSITTEEFASGAQCCFERIWCVSEAKCNQAVVSINSDLGGG